MILKNYFRKYKVIIFQLESCLSVSCSLIIPMIKYPETPKQTKNAKAEIHKSLEVFRFCDLSVKYLRLNFKRHFGV